MSINGRAKGAGGEREFASWLQQKLELPFLPKRNLEQVRSGGADILGVEPFIFEVKRCETLSLRMWWLQVVKASRHTEKIPVVAYRQNRQPWRFLLSCRHLGLQSGYLILEEKQFIEWAKLRLQLKA